MFPLPPLFFETFQNTMVKWQNSHLQYTIEDDDLTRTLNIAFERTVERIGKRPVLFALHPSTWKKYGIALHNGIVVLRDKKVRPGYVYVALTER